MKYKLGGNIFLNYGQKIMVAYDNSEVKKAEGTKKGAMKTILEFEN